MDRCKCGCRKIVKFGNVWIVGHNVKGHVHPSKGKKQTDEHIHKRTKNQIGSKRSLETRKKMSESAKERCADPVYKEKFIKQMTSPEVRAKVMKNHNPAWTGKKRPEHSLAISGSNHHNWKGGISAEPYCDVWLDEEYKESIRERDNYKCQNPGCSGTVYDEKLSIHHIDYNKKNCRPDNLITLCRGCNSIANWSRQYWQAFYQTLTLSS